MLNKKPMVKLNQNFCKPSGLVSCLNKLRKLIVYDVDIYRSDLYANEMISDILAYSPPWSVKYRQIKNGHKAEDIGM